ncbi:hypothetical protein M5689_022346 [Euphorbia peplus]|nr:hypothetical protein M5689_022346 [Euphorbia peplus]
MDLDLWFLRSAVLMGEVDDDERTLTRNTTSSINGSRSSTFQIESLRNRMRLNGNIIFFIKNQKPRLGIVENIWLEEDHVGGQMDQR